jgi:hypothetical protein
MLIETGAKLIPEVMKRKKKRRMKVILGKARILVELYTNQPQKMVSFDLAELFRGRLRKKTRTLRYRWTP